MKKKITFCVKVYLECDQSIPICLNQTGHLLHSSIQQILLGHIYMLQPVVLNQKQIMLLVTISQIFLSNWIIINLYLSKICSQHVTAQPQVQSQVPMLHSFALQCSSQIVASILYNSFLKIILHIIIYNPVFIKREVVCDCIA